MRNSMLRKSAGAMSRASGLSTRAASALASATGWQCGITALALALTSLVASSAAAAGSAAPAPADLLAAPDSVAAVASGPHWVQATPSGGTIVALAQAPSSPQTLYAVADTGDLFASENGGASWSARRGAPPDAPITSLVVDPRDAATVYGVTYASSGSSLLRTRNGARSWQGIGFGVFVFTLLLDAKNPNILYAASLDGLYRSSDGGASWTVLAFAGLPVVSLAKDPFDGRRLLATVGGNATSDPIVVWTSLDRGETWQPTSLASMQGGIDSFVPLLVFDPARRATAYAFSILSLSGNIGPLFRTQDGGASWSPLPAASGVRDLAASPSGTLYAATDFGVAHSNDAGSSWQPPLADPTAAGAAPPDIIGRVVAFGSPATVFAAGSQGIWKSTDGGQQWSDSNRGLVALNVSSIAATPTGPPTVVAIAGHGIFGSRDHGQSWERLHTDFEGPQPDRLVAFDPRDPRRIYGFGFDGQADHFFASADGGHSWQQPPFPYGCGGDSICDVEMTTFALGPANPRTIFVGGFFYYHYSGSGKFLLRSDDGGATWSELAPPDQLVSPMLLAIDPTAPARFYVLSCGGLYRSEDSGAPWYPVGQGLPITRLCVNGQPTLALDPSEPRIVYVGTPGHGVYRSTDDGANFHPFGHGLESANIASFVVDPENPANLYAGVAGQGVWSWNAGLRTWMPLSAGLPVKNFYGVLALDPQDPAALYAGTDYSGVFRLLPP